MGEYLAFPSFSNFIFNFQIVWMVFFPHNSPIIIIFFHHLKFIYFEWINKCPPYQTLKQFFLFGCQILRLFREMFHSKFLSTAAYHVCACIAVGYMIQAVKLTPFL